MRPIKLKIKGLNSFIEEQTIDFDELTSKGLFGIFGPTGSGKSTVLDGITLALYGNVSRKSSNFINTNCDSTKVSFEFQISGATTNRYLVERSFKRNNRGGISTSGAKVVNLTKDEVLADKATMVTKTCEEIIGLNLDDFTRTVVLPQGKFSEFLKLEGKDRREMLERLFNLGEYGDQLAAKLSKEIAMERSNNTFLLGELKGYEEINEDYLKEKTKEAEEANNNLEKSKLEAQNLDKEFKEAEEVWNLQLELNNYKAYEEKLKAVEKDINEKQLKVKLGESALKVNPYIIAYENTLKEKEKNEEELKILSSELEKLKVEKEEIEKKYIAINERKNKELPNLKVKEQQIKDAIEDKKALEIIISEINRYTKALEQLKQQHINFEDILKSNAQKILLETNTLKEKENKFESLKIEDGLKEKIQGALLATENYKSLSTNLKANEEKIKNINEEIENYKKEYLKQEKNLEEKSKELNNEIEKYDTLLKNCPGEQKDLLNLQVELNNNKESWNKFNSLTKEIENSTKIIETIKELIKDKENNQVQLNEQLEVLRKKHKELQIETIAIKLRQDLKENESCPVCGSKDHHIKNLHEIDLTIVENVEKEINEKDETLKAIEKEITINKTKYQGEEDKINTNKEEVEKLGEDFKQYKLEELESKFIRLKDAIENYNKEKEILEKTINILKEDNFKVKNLVDQYKIKLETSEKVLISTNKEIENILASVNIVTIKLNNLKEATKVEDFEAKNREIIQVEKEREELSKEIKTIRINLEALEKEKEKTTTELNTVKERIVKGNTAIEEKEASKAEKIKSIINKIGETENPENIENLLINIQNIIKSIEDEFDSTEKIKGNIEDKYKNINERYIASVTNKDNLLKREVIDKENLQNALKEENLNSIEEVKSYLLPKNIIESIKSEIEKYKEEKSKVEGAIENINKKINNRSVTEEKWNNLNNEKNQKEIEIKALNEIKIKVDQEVETIKVKLKELGDLQKKKAELDHKLGILADLEKLFKGKKFVEYIASSRLKYISIEASKKLKDITNGNYGLEVDEDGRFIIRDYKNGGAQRDASTLSGGETFLASLALALSLSSEIQLKGTAPLELFFLDEGFGTLDEDLLEIVMSSLERLHNDKLKVGIISHVESIKNRIPVKLNITPAKSGKGGSKVKIEVS